MTVAADAHAKDCLRVTAAEARRCRAQAALMMRQMLSGTRLLERRQAAREEALQALEPGPCSAARRPLVQGRLGAGASGSCHTGTRADRGGAVYRTLPRPCRAHLGGRRAAGQYGVWPAGVSIVAGIVRSTAPICKRTVRRKPVRLAQRAVRPALLRQAPKSAPEH